MTLTYLCPPCLRRLGEHYLRNLSLYFVSMENSLAFSCFGFLPAENVFNEIFINILCNMQLTADCPSLAPCEEFLDDSQGQKIVVLL